MTLATRIREELAAIESLRRLLEREYAALKSRDVAVLEQVVQEKQGCAEHLRALIADRLNDLRKWGIPTDAGGWAVYVESLPGQERAELGGLWAELEQAADQLRAQNEVNGAIIAASRNHVERTLAILRGRDSLDFLYGHDTRKVFGVGAHPIAKA